MAGRQVSAVTADEARKHEGLAGFVERCSVTGKAMILLVAIGGAGLSVGLLFDDMLGLPRRVQCNTRMIREQDSAHLAVMTEADSVTTVFRDSILTVQSSILRTLRAWLCIESARLNGQSTAKCGLEQLLSP